MKQVKVINGEKVQVEDEKTYRQKLLTMARTLGCEMELKQIFNRYDGLMKNCKNEQERKAIAAMGVQELSNLLDNGYLGKGGIVTVGGTKVVESKDDK